MKVICYRYYLHCQKAGVLQHISLEYFDAGGVSGKDRYNNVQVTIRFQIEKCGRKSASRVGKHQ